MRPRQSSLRIYRTGQGRVIGPLAGHARADMGFTVSVFAVERDAILGAIDALLQMPVLKFEKQPVVREFISRATQSNGGLADLLIGESCRASGCEAVLTFDKGAAKNSPFTTL